MRDEVLRTIKEVKISVSKIDGIEQFNDDIDIANALIERSGAYLEYLSDRFKDDKEIVGKAVNSDGRSIRFASKRLQNDPEIVKAAILDTEYALRYLPRNILDVFNRDEIIVFTKAYPYLYAQLSYEYKNDIEIAKIALSLKSDLYRYMPQEIKDNKIIAKEILYKSPRQFEYFNDKFKDDEELVTLAVSKYSTNYEYVSDRFKNDEKIFNIVKEDSMLFATEHASKELLSKLDDITFTISRTYTGTITQECIIKASADKYNDIRENPEQYFDKDNANMIDEDLEDEWYSADIIK